MKPFQSFGVQGSFADSFDGSSIIRVTTRVDARVLAGLRVQRRVLGAPLSSDLNPTFSFQLLRPTN